MRPQITMASGCATSRSACVFSSVPKRNSPRARTRAATGQPPFGYRHCAISTPSVISTEGLHMMDVMIVDDEPMARRTLRECCAKESDLCIVGEYGDSKSALTAIRAQPPQLLFLDIQIDSTSGLALARELDPTTLPMI